MATKQVADSKKRASILLALLLLAAAVATTIITLQDGRVPARAPESPTGTNSVSSEIVGPQGASRDDVPGDDSSHGARCVLEIAGTMTCPRDFTFAGNADGLYPGKTVQLPLTIENPYEDAIRVTSIHVSITGTSASSCSASNLQATDYSGPGFVVQGKASGSLSLALTMSRAAPDACQNVMFSLSFTGEAEQA